MASSALVQCAQAIENGDPKSALVQCAQAIENGDPKLADSLLERIWNLASDKWDEQRSNLVKYFAEALVRRAYRLHSAGTDFTLERTTPFYYWKFIFDDSFKNAINKAVMGKKRLHLIDFYIPHVHGWDYLLLNSKDFLSVRVSVIIPSFLKKSLNIQKEKEYLSEEAERFNIKLEENLKVVYANSLGEVDDSMLDFRKTEDEGVVVYYSFKLHKLLAEVGAMEKEMLKLRHINPEVVIINEQDANLNDSNFITRLKDSFQYYSDFFHLRVPANENENYYRQQILNIVGCEGGDRIVRQQTLAQWRSCFKKGGFLPIPLKIPIELKHKDDEIHEDDGSLVITKQNRPMFFISAWKLNDGEDHLNPSSNNLEEQGLNPSLQLEEDRVQRLPYFPEGLSLNRLAAASEIYAMLEEVSVAYDLPLALMWACEIHLNEIRDKNTLSIQSTFCYEKRSDYAGFFEIYRQYQLLEEHDIAMKALQSSEHSHFEPSILKLQETVHPHAVMAICLQNKHTDDVYVVEFFLPPRSTSLAVCIFNDLKKMKKKFVKVSGVFQGLNEQVPNFHPPLPMHASSPAGPHKQGIGKQTPFEPLAINENEMVKDDVNNLPSSTTKKRKGKSAVWEDFDKQELGGKKCAAICKHCKKEFNGASTQGTTRLRNHLKSCKSKAENDRSSMDVASLIIHTSALETSTFDMTAFGTNTSGMSVVSTNNVFRINTSEQRTFGTIVSPTPLKIDFHGFQVKVEHKRYLEGIYEKEGTFWSTCTLKVKEAISFMLDILGNALMIADTPWSTISKKDLQHMLDSMDDAIRTGFNLRCLDVCRQKAQSILSIDIDQPQIEAKLGEISKRIASLKQELQVITQELERQQTEELKLRKQLDAITHLRSCDSSPWSNIIE